MPFCPKCRCEYRHGFSTCSDCGEQLVSYLPEVEKDAVPQVETEYKDWLPIARIAIKQLAYMLEEALRSKKIPAHINPGAGDMGLMGMAGGTIFNPLGGIYILFVPKEFAYDAVMESKALIGDDWENISLVDIE